MRRSTGHRVQAVVGSWVGAMLAAWLGAAGCTAQRTSDKKLDLGVAPMELPLGASAAHRDTIGAYTYYEGLRSMRVRGYGLVVGLGRGGSSDCPRPIYERLVENLYRTYGQGSERVGVASFSPEKMIRDLDTAVVVVEGNIPPGAVRGSTFDVVVTALPGTQTASLRHGRLLATELEVFRAVSDQVTIRGRVLARAAGPLFINPFSDDDSPTQADLLTGEVPGGGVVLADRRVRLVLSEPSYQRAQAIQNRINARFSGPAPVADAISPSYVRLRIPEEDHRKPGHFLSLVRAMYLTADPAFQATRAQMLADEIRRPDAPHAAIALAFEGLGRTALPSLDQLYKHSQDYVSFHAAVAGLRLSDHVALDVLALHARDAACPFRFQAIRALGGATGMAGAAMALRGLLHDPDFRVQTAAYEALVERSDAAVQSVRVGGDGFVLDVVDTTRPNLIYVRRAGARRIALLGRDFYCTPPVLYRSPDGALTMQADAGDETLTLLRGVPGTGSVSPPIRAPLELPALIRLLGGELFLDPDGEVGGLELDYGSIARALSQLCGDGSINARFLLEQPNAAELFGPTRPAGRPESEL